MRERIIVLDILSLLGALSPMCPTHTFGGPAQEEDFPSFPSGVWDSQASVHHCLLFTHAALLDTSLLSAGYPAPGQLHLSPMFFIDQSLMTLVFLDCKMERNDVKLLCEKWGHRAHREASAGSSILLSMSFHASLGPGRVFSFRRCLKTWLAWIKGFSISLTAGLQKMSLATTAEPSCCSHTSPGPWVGDWHVARLRSLTPAPMPYTESASPAAHEDAQFATNWRQWTTSELMPLF